MSAATVPTPALRNRKTLRTVWLGVFVAALLLKAMVPLLAALAAQAQGIGVVEICSVYGVRAVLADAGPLPSEGHANGDLQHCPLTPAFGALLPTLQPPPAFVLPAPGLRRDARAPEGASAPDRARRWLALRLHAPPTT
jgi:hypothetical protein